MLSFSEHRVYLCRKSAQLGRFFRFQVWSGCVGTWPLSWERLWSELLKTKIASQLGSFLRHFSASIGLNGSLPWKQCQPWFLFSQGCAILPPFPFLLLCNLNLTLFADCSRESALSSSELYFWSVHLEVLQPLACQALATTSHLSDWRRHSVEIDQAACWSHQMYFRMEPSLLMSHPCLVSLVCLTDSLGIHPDLVVSSMKLLGSISLSPPSTQPSSWFYRLEMSGSHRRQKSVSFAGISFLQLFGAESSDSSAVSYSRPCSLADFVLNLDWWISEPCAEQEQASMVEPVSKMAVPIDWKTGFGGVCRGWGWKLLHFEEFHQWVVLLIHGSPQLTHDSISQLLPFLRLPHGAQALPSSRHKHQLISATQHGQSATAPVVSLQTDRPGEAWHSFISDNCQILIVSGREHLDVEKLSEP